jgi:hypothetical protein
VKKKAVLWLSFSQNRMNQCHSLPFELNVHPPWTGQNDVFSQLTARGNRVED